MRYGRWFVLAVLILAGVALPLSHPTTALAETTAMGPLVAIAGEVESWPGAGRAGRWVVDGTAFEGTAGTLLIEAAGPVATGTGVTVLACRRGDGSLQALVVRTQAAAQTARMQAIMARVRSALGQAEQLRLQNQTRAQEQQRLQNQTRAQEQARTQTQQQLQGGSGTQDQTQLQTHDQTQLQTQDQLRLQDGSCAQDQPQQTQEQAGVGQQVQNDAGAQNRAGQGR